MNSSSEFTNLSAYVAVWHAFLWAPNSILFWFGVFMCIVQRFYHNPTGDVNGSESFMRNELAVFATRSVISET